MSQAAGAHGTIDLALRHHSVGRVDDSSVDHGTALTVDRARVQQLLRRFHRCGGVQTGPDEVHVLARDGR